jgi:hypothetical protein
MTFHKLVWVALSLWLEFTWQLLTKTIPSHQWSFSISFPSHTKKCFWTYPSQCMLAIPGIDLHGSPPFGPIICIMEVLTYRCVLTKKDRGLVSVDYLPGGCLIATTIFALAVVIQWPPWGAGNHRWITNGSLTAPGLNPESKSFFFCIMDKCRETQRI